MRAPAAAMVVLVAAAARASPPEELYDPVKTIEYDLYDFSPEDQAAWEASRYAGNAARLNLGSVTLKELFAVQQLQGNLRAAPWLLFHLDVHDDRTREAEVARFSADAFFRVAPGLELAASGSPDLRKQDSALGAAALLTSPDRARYAMVRVLADRTPFEDGGARRDRIVWRAQTEARWAQGAFSGWLRADLGTPDAISYALAPASGIEATSEQRSDVDAHLRWAVGRAAAGLRVTARRLDSSRNGPRSDFSLRRGFGYLRAYLLAPILPRLQVRGVALGWAEKARGADLDGSYTFHRWDAGGRLGAVFIPQDEWKIEAGYALVHSAQRTAGAVESRIGDKIYGSAQWLPSERVRLRFLISKEIASGNFGGMNGELGVLF